MGGVIWLLGIEQNESWVVSKLVASWPYDGKDWHIYHKSFSIGEKSHGQCVRSLSQASVHGCIGQRLDYRISKVTSIFSITWFQLIDSDHAESLSSSSPELFQPLKDYSLGQYHPSPCLVNSWLSVEDTESLACYCCWLPFFCSCFRSADGLGHSPRARFELSGSQIPGWAAGLSLPPLQLPGATSPGLDVPCLHSDAVGWGPIAHWGCAQGLGVTWVC